VGWISTYLVCGAAVWGGAHPAHVEYTARGQAGAADLRDSHPGVPLVGVPAVVATTAIGFYDPPPRGPVDPTRPNARYLQLRLSD
jgi:hypothetical protein